MIGISSQSSTPTTKTIKDLSRSINRLRGFKMQFKIHITTDQGELLDTIIINTDERNWDTSNTKGMLAADIFTEIYRHIKKGLQKD